MAQKLTLREQRRLAREAQQRKQRNILIAAGAGVLVLIALFVFLGWNNNRQAAAAASATTAAQMATNTVIAVTQAVQATSAKATGDALADTMKFTGVPTDTVKTASGLQMKDVAVGTGPQAKSGDTVLVNYTGWLTDGTKFDSSVGGSPFPVTIGKGNVIKGWEEGLAGMKVGGRRILVIPPELGYGAEGSPPTIPANATLVFLIELEEIQ